MLSNRHVALLGTGLLALAMPAVGKCAGLPLIDVKLLEHREMHLPKISPDGKWLVYLSLEAGASTPIVYIRPFGREGSGRVLAETVWEDSDIAWSHSGEFVAMLRPIDNGVALEVRSVDSLKLLSVHLPEQELVAGLSWTADDGHLIVGYKRSLAVIDVKANEVVRHIKFGEESLSPDLNHFSISGENKIAFSARSNSIDQIWIANIDSEEIRPIPATEGPEDLTPVWINDSTIVFSRAVKVAGIDSYHLWKFDIGQGKEKKITYGPVSDAASSWSDDQRLLVFSRLQLFPTPGSRGKSYSLSEIGKELTLELLDMYFNVRVAYMKLE